MQQLPGVCVPFPLSPCLGPLLSPSLPHQLPQVPRSRAPLHVQGDTHTVGHVCPSIPPHSYRLMGSKSSAVSNVKEKCL